MALKLDFTKPYGTVHGTLDNRRFEQGGRFFDDEANEVVAFDASTLTLQTGPRKRTREEEAQYQQDVEDAAKLLAAGKK